MTLGRCRLGMIDFTEFVEAKKLFCEVYLKSQQAQFVADIRKALGGTQQ